MSLFSLFFQKFVRLVSLTALCLLVATGPALSDTLGVGDKVPNFTLINQNGQNTSLSDFQGQGVVLSFLYTKCPMPNKCPMIRKKLMSLADLSSKFDESQKIQVLAITIDPENDTPEVLKAYAQGFDKKHENWLFLTGSSDDIAKVAGAFGVLYWNEDGVIEHNMKTIFLDPRQTVQLIKSGSDWKAGEFAAQIVEILK